MKQNILVIHGPNLNLLGAREPDVYGSDTLEQINSRLSQFATQMDFNIEIIQSNSEGQIIDALHKARGKADGVVINPGAYSHYSLAIYDAVIASALPVVEVHLSNVFARDQFRRQLVIAPACVGVISGLGWRGYIVALETILNLKKKNP